MERRLGVLDDWIKRYYKYVLIAWLIALLVSAPFALKLFSIVSYNIGQSGSNGSNSSVQQQVMVITGINIYSNSSKTMFDELSSAFKNGNVTSLYSTEYALLNGSYSEIRGGFRLALSELYATNRVTGANVSRQLNATLVDEAILTTSSGFSRNSSKNALFVAGPGLAQFVTGAALGYANSTPSYVFDNYEFPNYPVMPAASAMALFVNNDHNTTIAIVNNETYQNVSAVASALASSYGAKAYVTGGQALLGNLQGSTINGTTIAILVGILIAIIVTGFIFRSPIAAFVPLVVFGIDVVISYAIFYIVFNFIFHSQLSFFDPAITSILMLGLSTDYLVYILYRYKQERIDRVATKKATSFSINHAGESVLVSGITVISAYIVLSFFNLAFIGNSGPLNAMGISVVLLSALTLLPALMYAFGDRLIYPHRGGKPANRGYIDAIIAFDKKYGKTVITLFIVATIIAAYVFITFGPDLNFLGLLPASNAKTAFYVATNNFGYDPIDPLVVSVNGTANSRVNVSGIIAGLENLPGVNSVVYGASSYNQTQLDLYMNDLAFSKNAINTYNGINAYMSGTGVAYSLSGTQSFLSTSFDSINNDIPVLILVLGIVIFMILFTLIYSVYTPLRLVLMLISIVVSANALTVFLFAFVLSLPIIVIAQVFLIINMLGVGVDYDIFLVMRIREHVKRGETNENAIANGLKRSGPIIMGIGFVLATVFFSLIASGIPLLAEVGFIVGIGILLDTFLSILIIIPSFMLRLSRYNWWPSKLR